MCISTGKTSNIFNEDFWLIVNWDFLSTGCRFLIQLHEINFSSSTNGKGYQQHCLSFLYSLQSTTRLVITVWSSVMMSSICWLLWWQRMETFPMLLIWTTLNWQSWLKLSRCVNIRSQYLLCKASTKWAVFLFCTCTKTSLPPLPPSIPSPFSSWSPSSPLPFLLSHFSFPLPPLPPGLSPPLLIVPITSSPSPIPSPLPPPPPYTH